MGMEDDNTTETDSLLNKSTSSLDDNEESVDVAQEKGHSVGTKSLNSFYSFVFIINQIYGPGVLAIPVVFQEGMEKHRILLRSYSWEGRKMMIGKE